MVTEPPTAWRVIGFWRFGIVSRDELVLILRFPPRETALIPSTKLLNGAAKVPFSGHPGNPAQAKSAQVSDAVSHSKVRSRPSALTLMVLSRVEVTVPSFHLSAGVRPLQRAPPPGVRLGAPSWKTGGQDTVWPGGHEPTCQIAMPDAAPVKG